MPVVARLAEAAEAYHPVEVSLTGASHRLQDIPGSAHYIGQSTLEKYDYPDVNRVLYMVPGVNIREEDGFPRKIRVGRMVKPGRGGKDKVVVVPFGIDTAPWLAVEARRDGPFLFVGRLVPYKGLEVLLDAVASWFSRLAMRILHGPEDQAPVPG